MFSFFSKFNKVYNYVLSEHAGKNLQELHSKKGNFIYLFFLIKIFLNFN